MNYLDLLLKSGITSRFWTTPNGAPELTVVQKKMKSLLKYGFILVIITLSLLAAYIAVLMKTKGEAKIEYSDGELNISSNWRTNAVSRIRVWEQGADTYKIFTTRGGGKNLTLDLYSVAESFRNLAESPAQYKKGSRYYIALDIQYDIPVAASMRTQFFDFIFSEETTTVPETEISYSEQPAWLGP